MKFTTESKQSFDKKNNIYCLEYKYDLKDKYPEYVLEELEKLNPQYGNSEGFMSESSYTQRVTNLIKDLPWKIIAKENYNINEINKRFDEYFYGQSEIKNQILDLIHSMIYKRKKINNNLITFKNNENILLAPKMFDSKLGDICKYQPILLVGPPGVGKTQIAKTIAYALDRKFEKISLNGLSSDDIFIKGCSRAYKSSHSGVLIKAYQNAKTSNPVILLDEVDKMGNKGGLAEGASLDSLLLDILDPEQNKNYKDNFLEIPYDLSETIFILTANYIEQIKPEILNRCKVINLQPYTKLEKISIAKKILIPRIRKEEILNNKLFSFDDEAIEYIIKNYTDGEGSVRKLKATLIELAHHIQKLINEKQITSYEFTFDNISKILGKIENHNVKNNECNTPGLVNTLYVTRIGGGGVSETEVTIIKNDHFEVECLGSIKESTKESLMVAIAYIKNNTEKFGLNNINFNNLKIVLNMPGSFEKDGPSAGIALVTGILSELKGLAISEKIAMTGEITSKGFVYPVGGIKNKILGAIENKNNIIFIPKSNESDIEDIKKFILSNDTKVISVSKYEEIYDYLFSKKNKINLNLF
ncbi:S16 family serine protease [Mycoplasmopsis lipophila]|uniref:S16 family serine protease n=1 Tax=Mycoplasmopsis lipophila TaxID=2117 RepID=UPI003873B3B6